MQVFNTLGRVRQPFEPRDEGKVGIYVCGPTVQARPHLGHGRAAVAFDVIRRYLEWRGFEVTYVQNVTDVEDKIIAAAAEQGIPADELAIRYTEIFRAAYAGLGVLPPTLEPRATAHIPQMIAMIEQLIERGHAYPAGGDVYFAVRSFDGYGALSGRDIDELRSGSRVDPGEQKHDPLDFALWKAAKPGEPHWASPWGEGRPGWHIECSAMATEYLGFGFDIHAGGTDLIFPHHENEIAQAEAATGERFSRYWLHNGTLNLDGEKMSKSTGHVVDLLEALDEHPWQAVRLFYLRTHYRKPLDYTDEAMADATAQLERVWAFGRRTSSSTGVADAAALDAFREAMDDDFDAAGGLAVVFDAVREGNRLLDSGQDASGLAAAVAEIVGVLGLAPDAPEIDDLEAALGTLGERFGVSGSDPAGMVDALVTHRTESRDARDWATADAVRDALAEIGIVVEDGPDGSRWHRG
jgi:cysteinyl-tRNA synthetase